MLILFVYVFVNIGMVSGILPVCRRSASAGELRRLGTDRVDGRVWYR